MLRHRLTSALLLAVLSSALHAQSTQHLALNLQATTGRSFVGLGVQFDPYTHPVDPKRWSLILQHLEAMHPGFYRVMSGATDYCTGFDTSGTPRYRWKQSGQDPELQPLLQVLDFAQQHGTEVYLGEWSPPKSLGIQTPDDPRWPRIIADFLAYLIHERHFNNIHHYIFMNEPNGAWMWRGSQPSFDQWSQGIRHLRQELDAHGLQSVLITGPDNSGDPAWFRRSVADLHDPIGAWEQHIYARDQQVSSGAMEQQLLGEGKLLDTLDPKGSAKERFIAESGLETGKIEDLDQQPRVHDFDYGAVMADYVVQIARAGWGGADAWDLDDAMHPNGHGGLKVWGFFDSSTDSGMAPRPWYYAWSILSHALPRGATIVPLEGSSSAPVRAVAARWSQGASSRWSIVLVNHTDSPARVALSLPSGAGLLNIYRYFATEQRKQANGEPAAASTLPQVPPSLQVDLPSRGLVVLTTGLAPHAL